MSQYSKEQFVAILKSFVDIVDLMNETEFKALLNRSIIETENFEKPRIADAESILEEIKNSDRNTAQSILSDLSKDICIDILNKLNIKASRKCKLETLVFKIIDNLFDNPNSNIPDSCSEYSDLIEKLSQIESRDEVKSILSKFKVSQLKEISKKMGIYLTQTTKDSIIDSISQQLFDLK